MSHSNKSVGNGKQSSEDQTTGLLDSAAPTSEQYSQYTTGSDSPQLNGSQPRPMGSPQRPPSNSSHNPHTASNTTTGQGITPQSLRQQKSSFAQAIDQVVSAARTPVAGISSHYGQAEFKQKYMKGQYRSNDESSPYHNPRSAKASPMASSRGIAGAESISPLQKGNAVPHTMDPSFSLSGPSSVTNELTSGHTRTLGVDGSYTTDGQVTINMSNPSSISTTEQLLHTPLYSDSGQADYGYNDDDDDDLNEDDESLTEDPEIPYSVYGHLRFPDSEQVRYEYYRNPHYHTPLGSILRCMTPILRVTREERLHFVKLEERYLLWKRRKNQKKRLLEAERNQMIALSTQAENEFTHHDPSAPGWGGYHPPTLSASPMMHDTTGTTSILPDIGEDSNHENDNHNNNQVVGYDDLDDLDPAPQHAIETESFSGNLLETQSFASASSSLMLNPQESPLVSTKLPRSIISWPLKAELFGNLHLSIPLILSLLASYGIGLINLAFQGRISEDALAAAAVAIFYINVTGMAVMLGLNGAIDILGSQAYGAQAYKRVGLITQRGLAVCTVSMFPVALMWYFGSFFLQLLGIEAHVSDLAQDYLRVCIIAIPFVGYMDSFRRYLEVQQICYPPMMINVIGLFLVAPLNWLIMNHLNFGYIGAAYSFVIINLVMFACFIVYIFGTDLYVRTWPKPSREIFYEWGHYMKYALPAVGALAGEWVAFEVQTLISARLGTTALAAQSLVTSLNAFIFNIPMAIGIAACARTGAFLGANKPFVAKHAYHASVKITLVTQALVSIFLLVFDEQIVNFFTNQENVKTIVLKILPFLACFTYVDGFQGMIAGIYRGLGYQTIAFIVNILGYWVIAIPISIGLALHTGSHTYPEDGIDVTKKGMGLIGQWLSLLVAGLIVLSIYFTYLYFVDWKQRAHTIHHELIEEIRAEKAAKQQRDDDRHAKLHGIDPIDVDADVNANQITVN